jgi:high-affinity nickel-transport protein
MTHSPFSTARNRLALTGLFLAALNIGAWSWAWAAARGSPTLLGFALVIYGLGLRHAVDADHIAAIDNVTRKLMNQRRQKPYLVGLWFAMGHSSIVTVVAVAVLAATTMLSTVTRFQELGGTISTTLSALFLGAIAVMNIVIFRSLYRSYRNLRRGGTFTESELELMLAGRGLAARMLRPLFRLVTRSWHMFALGILFGLGFDTATEIAMYSISAAQTAKGLPLHTVLVFPMLFAAGMSLVDTTDSVMMVGAYEWALANPMRRLFYNMTITLVSIVVAIMIGGIEALDLVAGKLSLEGSFWIVISKLKDNFNGIGFAVIAVFLLAWLLSFLTFRWKERSLIARID